MSAHLAIIAAVSFGAFVLIFGSSAARFTAGCFAALAAFYTACVLIL